jgi:excisionase family DNA binding protein
MTLRDENEVLISIALSADLHWELEQARRSEGQGDRAGFLARVLRRGLDASVGRPGRSPTVGGARGPDLAGLPLFSAIEHSPQRQSREAAKVPDVLALLTTTDAAEFLGVSRRTLEGWRVKGGGPRFVSVSRGMVRYRRTDLESWIEGRVVANTTEADNRLR